MARTGRMTLGLCNTYERGRFTEAHRRTLARAGPVAWAFEANLATFGFPFAAIRAKARPGEADLGLADDPDLGTPEKVAAWLSTTTSIGEGGAYLQLLATNGRFMAFPEPRGGFPPQLGTPVATTRRPDPGKTILPEDAARLLGTGQSMLLLFGLGPHGLPEDIRNAANHHLDLTGRGISLETATAIGAVPALITGLLRGPGDRPGPPATGSPSRQGESTGRRPPGRSPPPRR